MLLLCSVSSCEFVARYSQWAQMMPPNLATSLWWQAASVESTYSRFKDSQKHVWLRETISCLRPSDRQQHQILRRRPVEPRQRLHLQRRGHPGIHRRTHQEWFVTDFHGSQMKSEQSFTIRAHQEENTFFGWRFKMTHSVLSLQRWVLRLSFVFVIQCWRVVRRFDHHGGPDLCLTLRRNLWPGAAERLHTEESFRTLSETIWPEHWRIPTSVRYLDFNITS